MSTMSALPDFVHALLINLLVFTALFVVEFLNNEMILSQVLYDPTTTTTCLIMLASSTSSLQGNNYLYLINKLLKCKHIS